MTSPPPLIVVCLLPKCMLPPVGFLNQKAQLVALLGSWKFWGEASLTTVKNPLDFTRPDKAKDYGFVAGGIFYRC